MKLKPGFQANDKQSAQSLPSDVISCCHLQLGDIIFISTPAVHLLFLQRAWLLQCKEMARGFVMHKKVKCYFIFNIKPHDYIYAGNKDFRANKKGRKCLRSGIAKSLVKLSFELKGKSYRTFNYKASYLWRAYKYKICFPLWKMKVMITWNKAHRLVT